jgi:hypothetical protein
LTSRIHWRLIAGMNALSVNFLLVVAAKPQSNGRDDPDKQWQGFVDNLSVIRLREAAFAGRV